MENSGDVGLSIPPVATVPIDDRSASAEPEQAVPASAVLNYDTNSIILKYNNKKEWINAVNSYERSPAGNTSDFPSTDQGVRELVKEIIAAIWNYEGCKEEERNLKAFRERTAFNHELVEMTAWHIVYECKETQGTGRRLPGKYHKTKFETSSTYRQRFNKVKNNLTVSKSTCRQALAANFLLRLLEQPEVEITKKDLNKGLNRQKTIDNRAGRIAQVNGLIDKETLAIKVPIASDNVERSSSSDIAPTTSSGSSEIGNERAQFVKPNQSVQTVRPIQPARRQTINRQKRGLDNLTGASASRGDTTGNNTSATNAGPTPKRQRQSETTNESKEGIQLGTSPTINTQSSLIHTAFSSADASNTPQFASDIAGGQAPELGIDSQHLERDDTFTLAMLHHAHISSGYGGVQSKVNPNQSGLRQGASSSVGDTGSNSILSEEDKKACYLVEALGYHMEDNRAGPRLLKQYKEAMVDALGVDRKFAEEMTLIDLRIYCRFILSGNANIKWGRHIAPGYVCVGGTIQSLSRQDNGIYHLAAIVPRFRDIALARGDILEDGTATLANNLSAFLVGNPLLDEALGRSPNPFVLVWNEI